MRIFLLIFTISIASPVFANELHCNTATRGHTWNLRQAHEYLYLYSDITKDGVLIAPFMRGSFEASSAISRKLRNYHPAARDYIGYDRFEPLINDWYIFYPLLPNQYEKRRSRFVAYLQVFNEHFFVSTLKMNCTIKRAIDI